MNNNTVYKAGKYGSTFVIMTFMRLVGVIICLGTGGYFLSHFKPTDAYDIEQLIWFIFLALGLGVGLVLIGIGEIIFSTMTINDNLRRGMYQNIVETEKSED